MGNQDKSVELNAWITLLNRFSKNQPMGNALVNEIEEHFTYYWAKDRL